MKVISERINLLLLTVVLSISPLQVSNAAVTGCTEMMSEMQHEIQSSEKKRFENDSKQDCCKQNSCSSYQCTSSVMATISLTSFMQLEYITSNVTQTQNQLVNCYFPSSVYRPPRS